MPLVGSLILAGASASAAEGMLLIGIGPAQMGTAGAGIASPQDSTWLTLNPAAIIEIGERLDLGYDLIYGQNRLTAKGPLGNTAAGTQRDDEFITVPAATYTVPTGDGVLGLGLYGLSGLAINYPESRSSLGAPTDQDRRAEVQMLRAAASYAHTIAKGWAIGVALNLDYSDLRSDSLTSAGVPASADFERDHAVGFGFQVGMHRRWDRLSAGIGYTSRQWMQRFDRYRDLLIASLDQPQIVQAGVAWRLGWLEPLIDYRFIDWDGIRAIGDEEQGFAWNDQHVFKIGFNAYATPSLTLRGGVSYAKSPFDESVVFINALSPLISEWHATVGVSWSPNQRYQVQAAYMHAFRKTLTDDGSDVGGLGEGTEISLEVDSLTLGVGYRF